MKKIIGIGILCILVLSILPLGLAQIDQEDNTQEEVSTMDQGIGREVRLLQLEKSITRNILAGEEVIAELQEGDADTSGLETLITELEALKLEVQSLDPDAADAVQAFVNIKAEAIELSKEFRDLARENFQEGDRLAIAERLRAKDREELNEYNEMIRNRVRELNAVIAQKTLESLGIEDPQLVESVRNGESSLSDVKREIRENVDDMTPEEKREAWANLKQSQVRKEVNARSQIEQARLKINEREAKRLQWLSKAAENIPDEERRERVENYLQARTDVVEGRIERISDRLERAEEIRDAVGQKKGGVSE